MKALRVMLFCLPVYSEVFTDLKHLEPGKLGAELQEAQKLVSESYSNVEARLQIEKKLVDLLKAEDATPLAKRFACRELYRIGGKQSVQVLASMLGHPDLSQAARYALQGNRSKEADKALIEVLKDQDAHLKAGIINSLGARRQANSVPHIIPLLESEDAAVNKAALHTLGQIGGIEAIKSLKLQAKTRPDAADALLICAEEMKDLKAASDVYHWLYENTPESTTHLASLRGLLRTDPARGSDAIAAVLSDSKNKMQVQAAALVREAKSDVTEKVAALLPNMTPEAKQMLLIALADRGDEAVIPHLIQAAKDKDVSVRNSALIGLRKFQADKATVLFLLSLLKDEAVSEMARSTLALMPGPKTDDAILRLITESNPETTTELIRIIVSRRVPGATEKLLEFARSKDKNIRISALDALREIATEADLPKLISFIIEAEDAAQRGTATNAALMCAQRLEDVESRAEPFVKAMEGASSAAATSVLKTLGTLGGQTALKTIRKSATSSDDPVKDAALRALFGWQTSEVLDEVMVIAEKSPNKIHQVLALRACIRMFGLTSMRAPKETVQLFEKALKLAQGNEEKKKVLSGLAHVSDPAALSLAQALTAEPGLKAEAELAVKKIQQSMSGPPIATASHHQKMVRNALDGDPETRWDTREPMRPGMWFMLDLKQARKIETIELETKASRNDYPREFELFLSNHPHNFGKSVLSGKGHGPVTVMRIKHPVPARYLKIVQTGSSKGNYWSIHTMKVTPEPVAFGK